MSVEFEDRPYRVRAEGGGEGATRGKGRGEVKKRREGKTKGEGKGELKRGALPRASKSFVFKEAPTAETYFINDTPDGGIKLTFRPGSKVTKRTRTQLQEGGDGGDGEKPTLPSLEEAPLTLGGPGDAGGVGSTRVSELEGQLSALRAELEAAKRKLSEDAKKVTDYASLALLLEEAKRDRASDRKTWEAEEKRLTKARDEVAEEGRKALIQAGNANREKLQLEAKVKENEEEVKRVRGQLDQKGLEAGEARASVIAGLERQLAAEREASAALKRSEEAARTANDRYAREVGELKNLREVDAEEIKNNRLGMSKNRDALVKARDELKRANDMVEEWKKRHEDAQGTVGTVTNQVTTIKQRLAEKAQEVVAISKQLADVRVQLGTSQSETKDQAAEFNKRLVKSGADLTRVSGELKNAKDALEAQKKLYDEKVQASWDDLAAKKKAEKLVQTKEAELKTLLEKNESNFKAATDLERMLEAEKKQREELKRSFEALSTEKKRLLDDVEAKRSELDGARVKIRDADILKNQTDHELEIARAEQKRLILLTNGASEAKAARDATVELQRQLDDSRAATMRETTSLSLVKSELETLKAAANATASELSSLRTSLGTATTATETAKRETDAERKKRQGLEDTVSRHLIEIDEKKRQVESLQAQLKAREVTITDLEGRIKTSDEFTATLRREARTAKDTADGTARTLQAEVDRLAGTLESKDREIAAAATQLRKKETDFGRTEGELKTRLAEAERAATRGLDGLAQEEKDRLNVERKKLDELRAELEEQRRKLREADHANDTTRADLEAKTAAIARREADVRADEKKNAETRQTHADMTAEIATFKSQQARQVATSASTTREIANLKAQEADLKRTLEDWQRELTRRQASAADLEARIRGLEGRIQDAEAEETKITARALERKRETEHELAEMRTAGEREFRADVEAKQREQTIQFRHDTEQAANERRRVIQQLDAQVTSRARQLELIDAQLARPPPLVPPTGGHGGGGSPFVATLPRTRAVPPRNLPLVFLWVQAALSDPLWCESLVEVAGSLALGGDQLYVELLRYVYRETTVNGRAAFEVFVGLAWGEESMYASDRSGTTRVALDVVTVIAWMYKHRCEKRPIEGMVGIQSPTSMAFAAAFLEQLRVVASNAPRRYRDLAYQNGYKGWLATPSPALAMFPCHRPGRGALHNLSHLLVQHNGEALVQGVLDAMGIPST